MNASRSPSPRPYWHVDAKWVSGLLLLLFLPITILIFILSQITAPQQGISLLTTMLASSFSAQGGGLDATGDIDIMRQKIAESPTGEWQPIPGMRIVVRAQDIAGKTPREMRLWFFRQLAEPLYYDGEQGLSDLITDPEMLDDMQGGIGPLAVISAAAHGRLQIALVVSGLVSLVFLGLLIFFSYRFGRVGCPGCITFIAAVPGFIIMTLVGNILVQPAGQAGASEETFITRYVLLARDVLPDVVRTAGQIYLYLMIIGFALVVIGLVGGIIYAIARNQSSD